MSKMTKTGSGIRDEQTGSFFLKALKPFIVQILQFFDADPVSGMSKMTKDPESGMNIPDHILKL
jgi:hypothetical protein